MLNLFSGQTYTEIDPQDRRRKTYPSRRDKFQKQTIVAVLQGMELERKDESVFRSRDKALNNKQLLIFVDSIAKEVEKQRVQYSTSLYYMPPLSSSILQMTRKDTFQVSTMKLVHYIDTDSLMANVNQPLKLEIIERALNNARNNIRSIQTADEGLTLSIRVLNRFGIEWHKKYTFAFACIIFLFIGAPLGAIIRKGGLGMPLVISVVLFIFYWIMSTTGEKFARESVSVIWEGVWFTSIVFFPAGLFLTYKAANDSIVFNINAYLDFFRKFKLFKKKNIDDEDIGE